MPLNTPSLQSSLELLFTEPPATISNCASAWADAMNTYAVAIYPPSSNVATAAQKLETELKTVFQNNLNEAMIPILEVAFKNFVNQVGLGMIANGWNTTAPPGLVGFADLIGTYKVTWSEAASDFTERIDTWMRTGSAFIPPPSFQFSFWL